MASNQELACVYSALILQDNEISVSADRIKTILKAANVDVEPYWPGLFAKAIESIALKDLVSNVGAGAPAGPGAAGAAPAGAADDKADAKEEAKPAEEDEDSDADMGFGLFE